jgi:hypothetical protein
MLITNDLQAGIYFATCHTGQGLILILNKTTYGHSTHFTQKGKESSQKKCTGSYSGCYPVPYYTRYHSTFFLDLMG